EAAVKRKSEEHSITRHTSPTKEPRAGLPLYQVANLSVKLKNQELAEVSAAKIADWVWQVVQVESPVHITEVTRRIADAAGIAKIGPRVKTAIERAIDYGIEQGVLRREKDFLLSPAMTQPPLR